MKRHVRTHPYQRGAETDQLGRASCAECYLPEGNAIHQLPETTQAARDRDASILGEKEDA